MILALLLGLAFAPPSSERSCELPIAEGRAPEGLAVGHWVEVRGRFEAERLVASRVEVLRPERYELLIGTVQEVQGDAERFLLLGQPVHVSERTEWADGLRLGNLEGRRVKLEGRWRDAQKLSAREIEGRGPGRDRVGGRVDAVRAVQGGTELRVMSFVVFLPDGLEIEWDGEPASLERIAPRGSADGRERAGGEPEDYDDTFGEGFELLPGLLFTGQLELRSTTEEDFDLDETDPEDREDRVASARLRLAWRPAERIGALAEWRHRIRWRDDDEDGRSRDADGELGETYLSLWQPVGGAAAELRLGRQDFDDPREWVYDENLDAVRLTWTAADWEAQLSASTTLTEGSHRDRSARNWIGYLANTDEDRHLAAWFVDRRIDGGVGMREHSQHVGVRALGEWLEDTELWLEAAHQSGHRGGRDVSAWGYDAGLTWTAFDAPRLYLTAGYALGSGDRGAGGRDGNFRQTGFQDNNARLGGVTSFRYYGELIDPELSNLGVVTLGVGVRPMDDASVDLVWHSYVQDRAVASITDSELDMDPNGLDASLGDEWDLILGWRGEGGWDLEVVGARFEPGDAFPGADPAWLLKLQLRYRF